MYFGAKFCKLTYCYGIIIIHGWFNFPHYIEEMIVLNLFVPTSYRDRLRILLILYFFSENYSDNSTPELVKVLYSEVKIQKIDFLIRYPDYLCFELMKQKTSANSDDIKKIIKNIYNSKEPDVRKEEMLRYIYGAYEDIDDIIFSA